MLLSCLISRYIAACILRACLIDCLCLFMHFRQNLRIPIAKKQRLRKIRIWTFGSLVHRPPPPPHTHTHTLFPATKIFFPRNVRKRKNFACAKHMRFEFNSQTRHKWQKVDSFFWICRFNSRLNYHSYQQKVCKIMFLITTFVKTNSNLIRGSFK